MSRNDRILIAAGGGSIILAIAAGWLLVAPAEAPSEGDAALLAGPTASQPLLAASPAADGHGDGDAEIVVDVEGAVAQPGIHRLPAGSRVADAIAAAGGYGLTVDLDAAAAALNLARTLEDGEQVRVPARGEVAADAQPGGGDAPGGATSDGGGLVNLNTATPEELEALPGIGPVTVQKIVAARQERPFASLEEAVERKVMNRGQLEQIRELATAG